MSLSPTDKDKERCIRCWMRLFFDPITAIKNMQNTKPNVKNIARRCIFSCILIGIAYFCTRL